MSYPPPVPVEPHLEYATEYVDTRRPGILMAIGVLSIVFSVFYVLSAGTSILMVIGLGAAGATNVGVSNTTITVTTSGTTSSAQASSPAAPDGLQGQPRELLMARVEALTSLSPVHRDVLDAFLAQKGSDIDARATVVKDAAAAERLITSAGKSSDGQTTIDFTAGRLSLSDTTAIFEPAGTTDLITLDLTGVVPAPGSPGFSRSSSSSIGNPGGPVINPLPKISGTSITLQTVSSIVSAILALILLIAGILTLRARPAGRRLHLWWAWLKILASVLAAIALYCFYYDLFSSTSAATGGTPAAGVSIMMAVFSFAIALLYPIAVLIVMNVRSVKNYLSSVN